jgi:hypothetical protein
MQLVKCTCAVPCPMPEIANVHLQGNYGPPPPQYQQQPTQEKSSRGCLEAW